MALIDKASLLMVPSTYEDGTLYNVLPTGNKAPDETGNHNGYDQTRADFTFSRGFNLAATRVNANGLIEKGRENLLTYSNDFSNAVWYKVNTSVTSGQPDKDGGTDAWLLSKSAASAQVYNDESGNISTFSIYAKEGTIGGIRLVISTSSTFDSADFDLTNGVLGSVGSVIDANIESVGNGWYRCSIVGGQVSITRLRIYPITSGGDASGTSGSIYIQDAQLEAGLVATPYIETGATTATAGVLENTPRIDYSSGAGALLLEPQRTNVLPQSEYFGGSEWTKTNTAVTTNATTSPEGVQNASLVYPTASSSTKWGVMLQEFITGLPSANYTNTLYLKSNGWRWVYIIDPSGAKNVWFDLQEGVVGTQESNATGEIQAMGDGWYKCVVYPHTSPTTYVYAGVFFSDADNSYVCTPNGTNGAYIYGAQSESGSHVSSYVPTYGSAATRGADFMSSTNNLLSGADDMAWFVEYTLGKESTSSFRNQFGYRDNADANFYMVQFPNSNTHEFRYRGVAAQNIDMTPSIDEATYGLHRKIVYLKRGTTLKVFCNGSEIATTTNAGATTFSTTNENFGVGSNYPPEMDIRQFSVFNGSISDAEAIALTTL